MANRVRRQHVVSQFYLKGFANEASQLRRVVLPGDRSHLIATSDASVIKDFYTITLPDGSQSDMFERAFSGVEGLASEALQAVLKGEWPLKGEQRGALASWIALQHLRAEGTRASVVQHKALMIRVVVGVSGKQALRELIETGEARTVSNKELDWEWRDITKPGGPDLVPDSRDHLRQLMSLHDGAARYLYDCHWTVFRFARRALLTSDQPVVMTVRPDYPAWQGVGIATADAFLMPLGRRIGLAIQPRHKPPFQDRFVPDFEQPGTTKLAHGINQEIARQALRALYHHPDDSLLDDLYLPPPDQPQLDEATGDNLISENGLFHGMSQDQLKAWSRATSSDKKSKGMSIQDLPWPIPGRITPHRPTHW